MAVNPTTNRVYVTPGDSNGDSVWVIDGSTNTVIGVLIVRGSAVAVNPLTNRVYVVDSPDKEVSVIQDGINPSAASPPEPGQPAVAVPLPVGPPANPPRAVSLTGGVNQVTLSWTPPEANGAQIAAYRVLAGGQVIPLVSAQQTTVIFPNLPECAFYNYSVQAMSPTGNSAYVQSTDGPLWLDTAYFQPHIAPKVVAVLVTGVSTSNPGGAYRPMQVSGCSSTDGQALVKTYPPALQELVNSKTKPPHGFADPDVPFGYGKRMTDTLYGAGAVVLPASYSGPATLSGSPDDPEFNMPGFTSDDVAHSSPQQTADYLNQEIISIHTMWPDTRIVIVGHSNGGLVAFLWWWFHASGAHTGPEVACGACGVVQAFSLDGPINGVGQGACESNLNLGPLEGVPNPFDYVCASPLMNVGSELADWYTTLWKHQSELEPLYLSYLDQSPLFTAVGTENDPLFNAADFPATLTAGGLNIGIFSQVFFSQPSCDHSGWNWLPETDCAMVGPSLISTCPLPMYEPPVFGMKFHEDGHSAVKNCPGVIGFVMKYVSPYTIAFP